MRVAAIPVLQEGVQRGLVAVLAVALGAVLWLAWHSRRRLRAGRFQHHTLQFQQALRLGQILETCSGNQPPCSQPHASCHAGLRADLGGLPGCGVMVLRTSAERDIGAA